MPAKIRKGDLVEVLTGRDRGKRGAVSRVDPERARVWVDRVNVQKKHQKPNNTNRAGGIIEKEGPIYVSNLAIVHKGEPTRVGFREVDGVKIRWSKKHDEAIDG